MTAERLFAIAYYIGGVVMVLGLILMNWKVYSSGVAILIAFGILGWIAWGKE
ncbi:MAG: hypothetical protein V1907_00815 [Candidatus Kerfeldbacteria bacterium]